DYDALTFRQQKPMRNRRGQSTRAPLQKRVNRGDRPKSANPTRSAKRVEGRSWCARSCGRRYGVPWRSNTVKTDEPLNPTDVRLFCARTVAVEARLSPD